MKKKTTSFFYLFIALIFGASACFYGIEPSSADGPDASQAKRVPDEILVKFKGSPEVEVIKLAESGDFQAILDSYNANPQVEYAEPNYTYGMSLIPSDTYLANQWYLHKIKAIEAWDTIRESPNIIIAIMDSGIQTTHPDLADNIWTNTSEIKGDKFDNDSNGYIDDVNGWDFVNNTADPAPKFKTGFTEAGVQHGTVVAGIAAASGNNATGISGVSWKTRIMPLKVLDDAGEGNTSNVIKGIDYAIANGANIINFSFIGFGYSRSMDDAIKRAYDAGIVIVAAAGNEQENGSGNLLDVTPMYPVCYDGPAGENRVIGVAATDTLDQKAPFSSYGFNCVDLSAPGISIYSTVVYAPTVHIGDESLNKYYDGYWSGTSMATPMVSAAFALIEAVNPALDRDQIVDIILKSTDNINRLNPAYLNQLGEGRLNISAAVNSAKNALLGDVTVLGIAPYSNSKSIIRITDANGESQASDLNAFGSAFSGGMSIASGNFKGSNSLSLIAAPLQGNAQIRIFGTDGKVEGGFAAFPAAFRIGVNVATGDINGDGIDEIIVGAGQGGGPQVRVFTSAGKLISQFFAFDSKFRGGVNIAVGDVNGDGVDDIITGAGQGGGPQVRVFTSAGKLLSQFFAYDSRFRGGVRVATGDVDGGARGRRDEIITAPGQGGGPHIRIFNSEGGLVSQFFAYDSKFRGGVTVASGDINNDGFDDVITGAGAGGTPHVRVFSSWGEVIGSFYAFETGFAGGVNVTALKGDKSILNSRMFSAHD